MSVIERMKAAALALRGRESQPAIYALPPGYEAFGIAPSNDPTALLTRYRGWVAACVDDIAANCAKVPLRCYDKRNGKELPPENAASQFFENPSALMKRRFLTTLMFQWLEMEGDVFFYRLRDQMGVLRELLPIMPDRMKVIPDPTMLVKGYLYTYMGKEIPFEPNEILHIKFPNPKNLWRGMGTLEKAIFESDTDLYMKLYRRESFKNKGHISGVLESEFDVDPDQAEKLRKEWKRLYGGYKNSNKVAILSNGLSYKSIQLKPAEMEFLQSSKPTMEELIGIFRVPKQNFGLDESANRSNSQEIDRKYQQGVIKPKLMLVQEFWQMLVDEEYDERIEVRYDENVPQDQDFILKQQETHIKNGVIAINEIREEIGMEPLQGGEKPLVPWTLVPLGSSMGGGSASSSGDASADKQEKKTARILRFSDLRTEEQKDALWRAFLQIHDPKARAFESDLKPVFASLEKEMLANFKQYESLREPLDINAVLFDIEAAEAAFTAVADPNMRDILIAGLQKGLDDIGAEAEAAMNPRLESWLDIRKEKYSFQVTDTTASQLRNELSVGLNNSETIDQLRDRVQKVFQDKDAWEARRIAVTETTGCTNRGFMNALEITPGDFLKMWLTARDENTRDWHAALDGVAIAAEELFDNGLAFPGDPNAGDASEICNCRCTLIAQRKE